MVERGKALFFWAAALLLCCLYSGSRVKGFAEVMSVKYPGGGLSGEGIEKLYEREGAGEKEKTEVPYITAWDKKEGVQVTNEPLGRSIAVNLLEVYGDMTEVVAESLVRGSFVEKMDERGCVISLKTAERLYGSGEVLGCLVTVGEESYLVRGVIRSEEELLMVQSKKEGLFPYLEMRYGRGDYAASNTKAFLSLLGLPAYDSFTEGNLYGGLAGLFMAFPFLSFIIVFSREAGRQIKKEKRRGYRYLKRGVLLIMGLVLLFILGKNSISFSEDFVPAKVSDFEFWGDKFKEIRLDYKLMLQYRTGYKESFILSHLRGCAITSLAAGIAFVTGVSKLRQDGFRRKMNCDKKPSVF